MYDVIFDKKNTKLIFCLKVVRRKIRESYGITELCKLHKNTRDAVIGYCKKKKFVNPRFSALSNLQ